MVSVVLDIMGGLPLIEVGNTVDIVVVLKLKSKPIQQGRISSTTYFLPQCELETFIINSIGSDVFDSEKCEKYAELINKQMNEEYETNETDITSLCKEQIEYKARTKKLLDVYLSCAISKEDFKERNTPIRQRLECLEQDLLDID